MEEIIPGCASPSKIDPIGAIKPGKLVDDVLNYFTDRIKNIIGEAGHVGSLLSSKVARDLQLTIDAARQELHDELNEQWDRLDNQKISLLRELDKNIRAVEEAIEQGGKIIDETFLDAETLINKLPFTDKNVPSIRRIKGATQYYKGAGGIYRITIRSNIFTAFKDYPVKMSLNGKRIDPAWINLAPPYDVVIKLPSSELKFDPYKLRELPFEIDVIVPNRKYFFQIWRDQTRPAKFNFFLELFPIEAVQYRLTEYRTEKVIDKSKKLVQKGSPAIINGCGNSGCHSAHTICTDIPSGAQPIGHGDIYDSYQGFGEFENFWNTQTGICGKYIQHSHNQTRSVSFNALYYPLKDTVYKRTFSLSPLDLGDDKPQECLGEPVSVVNEKTNREVQFEIVTTSAKETPMKSTATVSVPVESPVVRIRMPFGNDPAWKMPSWSVTTPKLIYFTYDLREICARIICLNFTIR